MDLSRDEEGATQDRSNAPITTTHDPEQVSRKLPFYVKSSETGLVYFRFIAHRLTFLNWSLSGQRNQVLLLLQAKNAQEKVWAVEMTARFWENSKISQPWLSGGG